jgi:uncharacterized membrane protein HdeD (DUF308 family)
MEAALSRNWWAIAVRGFLALGLGIVAWMRPGLTLSFLILLFAVYVLDDGIFAIVAAVRASRRNEVWWPVAVEGVFGVAVGLIALVVPTAGAAMILLLMAVWAIGTGILELVAAVRMPYGQWFLALSGGLRILVGGMLLARPHAGMQVLMMWTAAYAIVYGVLQVLLSLRLRRVSVTPRIGGTTPQTA